MEERPDVSPGGSGFTARCFSCRNRYGLVNLIVLDSGVLCCRRCWLSRDLFQAPGRERTVRVAG